MSPLDQVVAEVMARVQLDVQRGAVFHDDRHGADDWLCVLRGKIDGLTAIVVDGAMAGCCLLPGGQYVSYRGILLDIAALAIQAVQSWDRLEGRRT
ncbi:MAG: hypothetical protein H7841_08405 [Magnetospirillum sp. WYHS-4]